MSSVDVQRICNSVTKFENRLKFQKILMQFTRSNVGQISTFRQISLIFVCLQSKAQIDERKQTCDILVHYLHFLVLTQQNAYNGCIQFSRMSKFADVCLEERRRL